MGGIVPLGYDVKDRKLVVNEAEAAIVRMIFERFVRDRLGHHAGPSVGGRRHPDQAPAPIDRQGYLYKLLNNRIYIGEAVHKGVSYPGEHQADHRPRALGQGPRHPAGEPTQAGGQHARADTPALLKGLIFGPNGLAMTPTHTRKGRKLYRYYVSTGVLKRGPEACTVRRVPAAEIERAVVDQVRALVCTPEIVVRTWKEAREHDGSVTEDQVRTALAEFSALWDELFPAEQARIIQLLVERVEIQPDRTEHQASQGWTAVISR